QALHPRVARVLRPPALRTARAECALRSAPALPSRHNVPEAKADGPRWRGAVKRGVGDPGRRFEEKARRRRRAPHRHGRVGRLVAAVRGASAPEERKHIAAELDVWIETARRVARLIGAGEERELSLRSALEWCAVNCANAA